MGKGGRSQKADAEVQLLRAVAADGAGKGMELLGAGRGGAGGAQRRSLEVPAPREELSWGAGESGASKGKRGWGGRELSCGLRT